MDSDRLCQRFGLPMGSSPDDLALVIQARKNGIETGVFRAAIHAIRKDDSFYSWEMDNLVHYTNAWRHWFTGVNDPGEKLLRAVFGDSGPISDPPVCPRWFKPHVNRWVRLDLPTPLTVRPVQATQATREADIREVYQASLKSQRTERMAPEGLCSRPRMSPGAYAATLPSPVPEARGYGPKAPRCQPRSEPAARPVGAPMPQYNTSAPGPLPFHPEAPHVADPAHPKGRGGIPLERLTKMEREALNKR
jgi:hypothetical protein